jgi:hypothetical protein
MSDSAEKARRLAETAVQTLLDELARKGRIEATGVSWEPPKEAPAQRKPSPSRRTIRAFLETALADGAVAVRDLEAKARAAMLLVPDLPISQCMPFRTVARKLKILSFREDDRWWWRLPMVEKQDDLKMIEAMPEPAPAVPVVCQDDIVAARRKIMEQTLSWHKSEEAKAVIKQSLREAEEIIKAEYARLGLDYTSRA